MITEAEAKTKWCPLARVALDDGSFNRWQNGTSAPDDALCIGSACMAWRWNVVIGEYPNNTVSPSQTHGFCGAFGETMLAVNARPE